MPDGCNRRTLLKHSMLAGAGSLAGASQKRPNIVILFTDDQRYDTVRALGNAEIHTPNMDRLVKRGTAFTHACIMGGSVGAVCIPSRAMLMTGQSLWHVNSSIVAPAPSNQKPFDLFPELLQRSGYKTFATGKWHNGPKLFNRCFRSCENIFFGGMTDQLNARVHDYDPSGAYPAGAAHAGNKFTSELYTDSALRFLENQKGPDPFLLYVAYTSPHDPRMAPSKFASMYSPDRIRLPANFMPQHPFDNGEMKVRDEGLEKWPRTPEAIRSHIAAYYAMVSEVDAQIGRVLDAVDRADRQDDTIIILAGDNGLAVGRHGLMGKQNVYEHSVRVPLVIAGPGIPKGKRVDSLCYLYDLFPTICEVTGIATPPSVEGKSLLPLMRAGGGSLRDSAYFAYRHVQRAIRMNDQKLILYNVDGRQTTQLFDLQADPDETRNLASEPKQAARIAELRARLKRWMRDIDDPLDIDLRDWGYKRPTG